MTNRTLSSLVATALCLAAATSASAAVINVSSDIATSTTWTANNTYNLQNQIYVLPGATLTIEPGTVIASTPTANGSGSLAVTRGAQIFAEGTLEDPIIFTSTADVATWANLPAHPTGKDPKTGSWRAAANEWGNLTIMGAALISDSLESGNSATPTGNNVSPMEGLTAGFQGDTRLLYGGNNDNDDSGTLSYVSIRYAGRVVGLGNELNGLSLGGIGRGTEISNIEIMNNVDDGIEIWGGTVNLKRFSIWNVGDDSLDIDQGWRGKAQFGLIVQGYSVDAAQGSGVGDNCMEMDGAENSDAQPVTRATIYNMTVIGQPLSGDHGTAWRDGAGVQIRNSIFMDLGDRLVSFDNLDGDGSQGYGFEGTTTWPNMWTTPYTTTPTVNLGGANPAVLYTAQSIGGTSGGGKLCEISDSVFFRNITANAYTESNARGVTVSGGNAPLNNNIVAAFNAGNPTQNQPIVSITRGPLVALQGGSLNMLRVTNLDARPANAAVASVATAPDDGFFEAVGFRGAFGPTDNWLKGWSAAWAYGNIADTASSVSDWDVLGE